MATPKVHLLGYTQAHEPGIRAYLEQTGQEDFWQDYIHAREVDGVSSGEALCSMYAKICYKSLVVGKNKNITGTRDVKSNIQNCMDVGHGSVFEHCNINFLASDVSRVFTHELVRHRVGTAFSQTSGRYVAIDDSLDLVLPPEITESEPAMQAVKDLLGQIVDTASFLRKILIEEAGVTDFARKKKITSAIRRIAPNGQTNEIGFTMNIRTLRHTIEMRTSRHAEWEIREVYRQVAELVSERFPLLLYGGKCEEVDGLPEWTGLRI